MTTPSSLFLVLGGTGGTGQHFIRLAFSSGHRVRALVRPSSTSKLTPSPQLEIIPGSITDLDTLNFDSLLAGVDYVISMLGDKTLQSTRAINTEFVKLLVPAMRKHQIKRFLNQAGGLSRPYGGSLSPILWILRNTFARGFNGQHVDNEGVMEYLSTECGDIEWIVHRAGIYGDGASKGRLERSGTNYSIGVHSDCADYNYRTIREDGAVHTSDFSYYA
jgi:hypothetical protein